MGVIGGLILGCRRVNAVNIIGLGSASKGEIE